MPLVLNTYEISQLNNIRSLYKYISEGQSTFNCSLGGIILQNTLIRGMNAACEAAHVMDANQDTFLSFMEYIRYPLER